MDFNLYIGKVGCRPKRDCYGMAYFYHAGQVVGSVHRNDPDYKQYTTEMKKRHPAHKYEFVPNEAEFSEAQSKYLTGVTELEERFVLDLFAEFRLSDDKFTRTMYEAAAELAESSSKETIYNVFAVLVPLALSR